MSATRNRVQRRKAPGPLPRVKTRYPSMTRKPRVKRKIGRKILAGLLLLWLVLLVIKLGNSLLERIGIMKADSTSVMVIDSLAGGVELSKDINREKSVNAIKSKAGEDIDLARESEREDSASGKIKTFIDHVFTVENVRLQGAYSISADTILARLGDLKGRPIFDLKLMELAKRIESHPRVKTVILSRQLPRTVIVDIKERRELALVIVRGKPVGVDASARVLSDARPGWLIDVPVVTGYIGELFAGREAKNPGLKEAMNWIEAAAQAPRVSNWITEIHVSESGVQWIQGASGNIVHPGSHAVVVQVAALNVFLAEQPQQLVKRKIVDLRFPGFLILKDESRG